jgi:predicted ATPase
MTRHFERDVLSQSRPYIKLEWCERALEEPEYTEVQADGTVRYWVYVEDLGKYLRVVTKPDGEAVITAHPDRRFKGGKE